MRRTRYIVRIGGSSNAMGNGGPDIVEGTGKTASDRKQSAFAEWERAGGTLYSGQFFDPIPYSRASEEDREIAEENDRLGREEEEVSRQEWEMIRETGTRFSI